MLRYGDGTPFPLTENALPVIADTVTTCTAMFEAAAELDAMRDQAQAARAEIDSEQRRLAALEQSLIEATTVPSSDDERPTASRRAAQKALAAGRRAVRESRQQLDRYASSRASEPSWERIAERVHAAAAGFFAQRTLPHTKWTWYWDASGAKPVAGAEGHAAAFAARFDLPLDPIWRAPVRVGVLVQGIVLPLHRHRALRRPVLSNVALDSCLLVYAARDVDSRVLLLREHPTSATSWRISIPDHGPALATSVDRRGRAASPDVELAGPEIRRLWAALETDVLAMLRGRVVREVLLDGRPLTEVRDVTAAPRALLDYLGPLIAEIRQRSRVPGELSLKRDVADGVREELFIPRIDITARYARLPAVYRGLLDAAGLGRGVTSVIDDIPMPSTIRTLPRAPRATPPPPPLTPPPEPVRERRSAPRLVAPPAPERPSVPSLVAPPIPQRRSAPKLVVAPAPVVAPKAAAPAPVVAPEAAATFAVAAAQRAARAPLPGMPLAPPANDAAPTRPAASILPLRSASLSGLITPAPVPLAKLPKLAIPHVPKLPAEAPTLSEGPRVRPSPVPLFDHGNVDFRKLRM